ncbi:mCG1051057, partial [Mus musculus]
MKRMKNARSNLFPIHYFLATDVLRTQDGPTEKTEDRMLSLIICRPWTPQQGKTHSVCWKTRSTSCIYLVIKPVPSLTLLSRERQMM